MFRPRIIPILLLQDSGLVKTKNFAKPRYIGDPINSVKILNDLKADELIFLDINASKKKQCMDIDFIKNIGDEAFMPFSVGGGFSRIEQMKAAFRNGAEKVVINTEAINNPNLIFEASNYFGSQSIVVSIDVRKTFFRGYKIYKNSGKVKTNLNLFNWCREVEELGAGEILLNSIDRDGMMDGYDLDLIKKISSNLSIPLVAAGGAGMLSHFKEAIEAGAHAVSAGSFFVYHGPRNAVLVNYPNLEELQEVFR
ncbi:MAG: AglZ/HisF2 family acetamidino modification protein [Candidatus Poseidoniales archaeon]